jgi:hypothetical protein
METPPIKLAFIIDNEVADILHTDERLSAIFLSNPVVLDVTDKINFNPNAVLPGMIYNPETDEYVMPEITEGENV